MEPLPKAEAGPVRYKKKLKEQIEDMPIKPLRFKWLSVSHRHIIRHKF